MSGFLQSLEHLDQQHFLFSGHSLSLRHRTEHGGVNSDECGDGQNPGFPVSS